MKMILMTVAIVLWVSLFSVADAVWRQEFAGLIHEIQFGMTSDTAQLLYALKSGRISETVYTQSYAGVLHQRENLIRELTELVVSNEAAADEFLSNSIKLCTATQHTQAVRDAQAAIVLMVCRRMPPAHFLALVEAVLTNPASSKVTKGNCMRLISTPQPENGLTASRAAVVAILQKAASAGDEYTRDAAVGALLNAGWDRASGIELARTYASGAKNLLQQLSYRERLYMAGIDTNAYIRALVEVASSNIWGRNHAIGELRRLKIMDDTDVEELLRQRGSLAPHSTGQVARLTQ